MTRRRVGILGGMGPQAALALMQRVIDAVPATDDADHVPLLVDQNPQVPSRIAFILEGRGPDPGPVLAEMARGLERAGADALAMPCNTAHHFAPHIRAATSLPFLDMIVLSARKAAQRTEDGTVGLLGSPALRRTRVFEAALAAEGLTPAYPDDEDALLAAIVEIKRAGPTPAARDALCRASEALLADGAGTQLVACTEFSLVADALPPDVGVIDTLDVLAHSVVTFSTSDQPEPCP